MRVSGSMALKVPTVTIGAVSSITMGRYFSANVGGLSLMSNTFILNVAVPVCAGMPRKKKQMIHALL